MSWRKSGAYVVLNKESRSIILFDRRLRKSVIAVW